jgi:hypothetical protein
LPIFLKSSLTVLESSKMLEILKFHKHTLCIQKKLYLLWNILSLFSKLFRLNFMKTKNIFISSLLALTLISIGCKKQEAATTTGGGSSVPTLTRYQATCHTTGGTVYNAQSYRMSLTFTGSTYSYSQLYYTDTGCSSSAYSLSSSGTFAIGAVTTSPAYGFKINFTPTNSTITVYDFGTAAGQMNSTCTGTTFSTSATSTYNANSSGLNCSALGLVAANTVIYNAFVLSGSTFSLGAFSQNNPGTPVSGSVATSTSVDLINY